MLDKEIVIKKMQERGFTVYAHMNLNWIHFISNHMYETNRRKEPVINIIVDLEKDEFKCIYNVHMSINTLNTPTCGSVLNDNHFDSIVGKIETHAKWLERITG